MILDNLHSLKFFLPELTLTAGILLVILCDITLKGLRNRLNPLLTLFTLVLAAYCTFQLNHAPSASLFHGMLAIDGFAQFFKLFLLLAALVPAFCTRCTCFCTCFSFQSVSKSAASKRVGMDFWPLVAVRPAMIIRGVFLYRRTQTRNASAAFRASRALPNPFSLTNSM